jgi:hypothetical protein
MSATYSVTPQQVIDSALRILGQEGLIQTMEQQWYINALMTLNLMVKEWIAEGATLWKIQELVIPTVIGQRTYQIGPTAGAGGLVTDRPLRILDEGNFIRNTTVSTNPQDTTIDLLGRDEYEMFGNKLSQSVINSIFYDPQLTNGVLSVYPTSASAIYELHLIAQMPIQDIGSLTAAFDFPNEWFNALRWNLAYELMTEAGADESTKRDVTQMAMQKKKMLFDYSVDEASMYFTYDNRGRGR